MRLRTGPHRVAGLMFAASLGIWSSAGAAAGPSDPFELLSQLAAIGPRVPGDCGHAAAEESLAHHMRRVGLTEVGRLPVAGSRPWRSLAGRLGGKEGPETILAAHYDTVEGSPGALDDASGCAVVLAAAADLLRSPRRNPLRVLLFDGEESQAAGSRSWLSAMPQDEKRRMVASLTVEMVGLQGTRRGVLHLVGGRGSTGWAWTPAWLVEVALDGAAAVDLPVAVLDRRWSWFAQLAVRCARSRRISDGHRFQEQGVPSLMLSDVSLTSSGDHYHAAGDRPEIVDAGRLRLWVGVVGAMVRRLDRLAERPPDDGEYLVLGGKVWQRRQLVWAGFLIWTALVWRALPGRWRGAAASERRRRGREYLPGFAFRMLFLLSVFVIPTFSTLLLYPGALAALLARRGDPTRGRVLSLAAVVPAATFTAWLVVAQVSGWLVLDRSALLPVLLVTLTLAALCGWLLDRPFER